MSKHQPIGLTFELVVDCKRYRIRITPGACIVARRTERGSWVILPDLDGLPSIVYSARQSLLEVFQSTRDYK